MLNNMVWIISNHLSYKQHTVSNKSVFWHISLISLHLYLQSFLKITYWQIRIAQEQLEILMKTISRIRVLIEVLIWNNNQYIHKQNGSGISIVEINVFKTMKSPLSMRNIHVNITSQCYDVKISIIFMVLYFKKDVQCLISWFIFTSRNIMNWN